MPPGTGVKNFLMAGKTPRPHVEIGRRIQDARRLLRSVTGGRVTQAELAERVGVAEGTVTAWEGGYQKPDGDNLIALATALGVSEGYILHGGEEEDAALFEEEQKLEGMLSRDALVRFAKTDRGRQAITTLREIAPDLTTSVEEQNRIFALLNRALRDAAADEP